MLETTEAEVHNRRLPKRWQGMDRCILRATEALVCLVGMTFTILITLEVISRYLFNFSIFFINSAAGFLLVWFFLLGAGLALRQSAHVGLDFVLASLPPRVARLAWTIAQGLLLVFLLAMFWSGCSTLGSASRQVEGALGISLVWVMLAFPVGFLLLIYHHVIMVVMTIRMPPAEDGAP